MAKTTPLTIYKLLPAKNCKICGEATCMSFASKLIERKKKIEDCTLLNEEQYKEKKLTLIELMTPPVRQVIIGAGNKAVAIGGEEVMYRHELTYFNPTAIFIDVHDEMSEEEIAQRVDKINRFSITRVGKELRLDGVAVRSASGDATKFGAAVLSVAEKTDLPMVLCSYDPKLLEIALEIAVGRKPLIYAATKENWESVANLALKHGAPVVASSPGDVQALIDLISDLQTNGVSEIVLDIGSYPAGDKLGDTLESLAMLRRLAIEDGVKLVGYPLLGVPAVAWINESDHAAASISESALASRLLLRFCDALILHTLDTAALLPVLTLRQNIYTDPRVPIQVDAGLRVFGTPNESSPVLLTSNFALTYYTVAGDLESAKVSCYVLVANTEGLAVEVAMAGSKLTADVVKDVIESSKIAEKVKHKKLILPGRAARISGEIEDATGWQVMVGPLDSSKIPAYLKDNWK